MATAKPKTSATRKTPKVDLETLTEQLGKAQAQAEEAVQQAINAAGQLEDSAVQSAQAAVEKAMQQANAAAEAAVQQAINQVSGTDPKVG